MKKAIALLVLTVSNVLFCSSTGDEQAKVINDLKKKLPKATLSYVLKNKKNTDNPEYYALFQEENQSPSKLVPDFTYTLLFGTKDKMKKLEVSKVRQYFDGGSAEIDFKDANSDPRTIFMKYSLEKNAFIDCALCDQETSSRKKSSLYDVLKHVGLEEFRQKFPDASEQSFKEILSSLKPAKTALSLIFKK